MNLWWSDLLVFFSGLLAPSNPGLERPMMRTSFNTFLLSPAGNAAGSKQGQMVISPRRALWTNCNVLPFSDSKSNITKTMIIKLVEMQSCFKNPCPLLLMLLLGYGLCLREPCCCQGCYSKKKPLLIYQIPSYDRSSTCRLLQQNFTPAPLPPAVVVVVVVVGRCLREPWCCQRCINAKQARIVHLMTYKRAGASPSADPLYCYCSCKEEGSRTRGRSDIWEKFLFWHLFIWVSLHGNRSAFFEIPKKFVSEAV